MLVPKLRFKREDGTDYPEWKEKKMSDICEPHARIGWQNLRTDEFLDEGDYYLITGTDFLNGRVNFATCHYIDRERFEQDKNIQITNGDILITKDGTLGKVALVENMDKKGTLNAGVFVLQNLAENIYNLYLYQYLTAPYLLNFAFDKATGGTIKHLNQGILVQFPVPIPCFEEQQKIADFLSDVDEVIAQSEKEVQNLEQQKKAAMQKIFSKEVRFKREDGTDYPEWEEKTVAKIFKITRGYVLSTKLIKPTADNEYCYPVFSSQTKDNGLMGYYKEYLYENAITWTTDGANAGTVRFRKGKFYCTNVCGVLLNETGFANQCIAEYLNSVTFKYVSYVGNPKLMNNIMAEIPIIIPCLEEQQKIADFLSAFDEAITYAKQELDRWKELKKGLLQQMFV